MRRNQPSLALQHWYGNLCWIYMFLICGFESKSTCYATECKYFHSLSTRPSYQWMWLIIPVHWTAFEISDKYYQTYMSYTQVLFSIYHLFLFNFPSFGVAYKVANFLRVVRILVVETKCYIQNHNCFLFSVYLCWLSQVEVLYGNVQLLHG